MIGVLGLIFSLTAIVSFLNALNDIQRVKKNPALGIKSSKNLISFLFTDYE